MNQSYKTIFSKVHQCSVVVSELAKSQGKGSRTSRLKKTAVTLLAATAFGGGCLGRCGLCLLVKAQR